MTLFVTKGDAPLTPVQLEKRAQKYIKRSWSDQAREKSIRLYDGAFDVFMSTFSASHTTNIESNTFNWQLAEYRKATARLEKYRLADGRAEVTESQPTGEQVFNEETSEMEDVMHDVITVTAIDPLEAQVEQPVYDDEGNQTGTESVDNLLIVTDDAEREAAQAVLDAVPQEVKEF